MSESSRGTHNTAALLLRNANYIYNIYEIVSNLYNLRYIWKYFTSSELSSNSSHSVLSFYYYYQVFRESQNNFFENWNKELIY